MSQLIFLLVNLISIDGLESFGSSFTALIKVLSVPFIVALFSCCFQGDDSYILPVLLRFDGQPEVDEEVC